MYAYLFFYDHKYATSLSLLPLPTFYTKIRLSNISICTCGRRRLFICRCIYQSETHACICLYTRALAIATAAHQHFEQAKKASHGSECTDAIIMRRSVGQLDGRAVGRHITAKTSRTRLSFSISYTTRALFR